jgi:hypothetical protein
MFTASYVRNFRTFREAGDGRRPLSIEKLLGCPMVWASRAGEVACTSS